MTRQQSFSAKVRSNASAAPNRLEKDRVDVCDVCWAKEAHQQGKHDYTTKREMAELLLALETAINN